MKHSPEKTFWVTRFYSVRSRQFLKKHLLELSANKRRRKNRLVYTRYVHVFIVCYVCRVHSVMGDILKDYTNSTKLFSVCGIESNEQIRCVCNVCIYIAVLRFVCMSCTRPNGDWRLAKQLSYLKYVYYPLLTELYHVDMCWLRFFVNYTSMDRINDDDDRVGKLISICAGWWTIIYSICVWTINQT